MDKDLMKRLGFAEGAAPSLADKMNAYSKHCLGEASDEDMKKMAADLDSHEEAEAKAMAVKLRKFSAPAADPKPIEPDADEKQALSAMAASLGLAATSTRKAILLAASAGGMVPMSRVSQIVDEKIASARTADEKARAEQDAAKKADELGATYKRCGASDPEVAAMIKLARLDYVAAETTVKGHPGYKLLSRMTQGGAPVGGDRKPTPQAGARPNSTEGDAKMNVGFAERSRELVERAKTDPVTMSRLTRIAGQNSHPGMLLAAAQKIVSEESPELVEWAAESPAALFSLP